DTRDPLQSHGSHRGFRRAGQVIIRIFVSELGDSSGDTTSRRIPWLRYLSHQTMVPFNLHLQSWRWRRQTQSITNPSCVLNRQVDAEARPRSGSMTRILISSLSKQVWGVLIPTLGSSRLPFRRTNSRSMAAKPM